jgi:hypothetical protein
MISLNDYRKEDGRVDWQAHRQAEINVGERCYKCGSYILFAKGYQTLCSDCEGLRKDEAITHASLIRCPKCGDTRNAGNLWEIGIHEDGEHEITCGECDHTFTVKTFVSYSFESPARLPEEEDDAPTCQECGSDLDPDGLCESCDENE